MQHLGVLEEANLVLARREGRNRLNYLNPIPMREVYERWINSHASVAAETALHLKRYAQTTQEVGKMDSNTYRQVRIEMEMHIAAAPERVFSALTEELGNWWPHRYKEGSKVTSDAEIGGKIQEHFANGGGALYGTYVYVDKPNRLMSSGPSSMHKGVQSFNSETMTADGDGTIYKRELTIWGDVSDDMEKMFREGSRAMMEQALRGYLEQGIRYSQEAGS